ncbi:MAG: LEA type 2 family protein [Candidatus Thiodiazotropha sp.]
MKQQSVSAHFRFPLLLVLSLLLSACASLLPKDDRVRVTIVDIRPLESTLMEQRFLVKLRLQNRSREELSVDGMSFDLELNGKDFASGVSNQAVTAPGFGEALIEVKVSSTLFGVIRQIQALQNREPQPFQYRISGSLSSPGSLFGLGFDERGEIDLNVPAGP